MTELAQCPDTRGVRSGLTTSGAVSGKHSDLILMPAENRLQCNEREMTWLKCRRGNQPPAEHLRSTAAYLSSARGLTQALPHGQEPCTASVRL